MNPILIKIFATALTLSQITTSPDDVKTTFDPATDRAQVAQLLSNGCKHLKGFFDIENIDMDDLIATAMKDPQAMPDEMKTVRGIDLKELHVAYREFCKGEKVEKSPVDIGEVITFYNNAAKELPDAATLTKSKLPGQTQILDGSGKYFAEVFEPNNRRMAVPLSDVPAHVQQAFISAEDKRFREHHGVDERGVIRAFISLMTQPGRPAGGSTITQQVVKNLLVGTDVTYERKIRELLLASKVEKSVSKDQILELYLNSIYLGRGAWGIELASQAYFGKPAKELTLVEGAFLAGLPKGPAYYNPDRYPERAKERLAYVLGRMQQDGIITEAAMNAELRAGPKIVKYERPQRDVGFHFVEYVNREAKALAKLDSLTADSYIVRSTIHPQMQRAAEVALQDGLARYERLTNRAVFNGPEANLTEAIKRVEADKNSTDARPSWQRALERANSPLYDVHWTTAVVVEKVAGKRNEIKVGLRDGRILPLSGVNAQVMSKLSMNDMIFVNVTEPPVRNTPPPAQNNNRKQQNANPPAPPPAKVELRIRPTVQGSALVLENKTGRILAMAGAFSFPQSQLNRATQTKRQPGSSLKPLTFLAALSVGRLQPNTLVYDAPIVYPPIGGNVMNAREKDYWSPKNYDSRYSGVMTLRRALENSKNLVTARLLDGGIANTPSESLDKVCQLAVEAQVYPGCDRFYPFVLGSQPVRMIDIAAFYATIANEGERPTPHAIESIQRGSDVVFRNEDKLRRIGMADNVAFFQLKSMLQGVVARGTAGSMSAISPFIAGKTGTSEEENDAWFVGFSNDITVAVWVGYDNADMSKRRTLGGGRTGGNVAVPIFEPIMKASWQLYAPQARLNGPSPDARRQLAVVGIDLEAGERVAPGERGFAEYLRLDRSGRLSDMQTSLLDRREYDTFDDSIEDDRFRGGSFFGFNLGRLSPPNWNNAPGNASRGDYQWEQGVTQPLRRRSQQIEQEPPITEYDRPRFIDRYRGPIEIERPRPRTDPDVFWSQRRRFN